MSCGLPCGSFRGREATTARAPRLHGLGREGVAVEAITGQADEEFAALHQTRVRAHGRDLHGLVAQVAEGAHGVAHVFQGHSHLSNSLTTSVSLKWLRRPCAS